MGFAPFMVRAVAARLDTGLADSEYRVQHIGGDVATVRHCKHATDPIEGNVAWHVLIYREFLSFTVVG